MMSWRRVVYVLIVFVLISDFTAQAKAAEPKIAINQIEEGRTEAVVTLPGPTAEELKAAEQKKVIGTIQVVEEGAVDVMGASSKFVGQGTDRAVGTVETVGNSAFAWLFKMLDFKTKDDSNGSADINQT
jgi:hypothetical protein